MILSQAHESHSHLHMQSSCFTAEYTYASELINFTTLTLLFSFSFLQLYSVQVLFSSDRISVVKTIIWLNFNLSSSLVWSAEVHVCPWSDSNGFRSVDEADVQMKDRRVSVRWMLLFLLQQQHQEQWSVNPALDSMKKRSCWRSRWCCIAQMEHVIVL